MSCDFLAHTLVSAWTLTLCVQTIRMPALVTCKGSSVETQWNVGSDDFVLPAIVKRRRFISSYVNSYNYVDESTVWHYIITRVIRCIIA